MKKRSQIFRDAMKYLAVDKRDFLNRACSRDGICGALNQTSADFEKIITYKCWLFNNGRGKKTPFYYGAYWLPTLTPESYTARIMLLELGALLSEEEGN